MHANSLKAYAELQAAGITDERTRAVYGVFADMGCYTDRQVLQRLKPGSDNMNLVRPRITGLVKGFPTTELGMIDPMTIVLEEVGKTIDTVTGKRVRICRVRSQWYTEAMYALTGYRQLSLFDCAK
jgi:hypothetical protein